MEVWIPLLTKQAPRIFIGAFKNWFYAHFGKPHILPEFLTDASSCRCAGRRVGVLPPLGPPDCHGQSLEGLVVSLAGDLPLKRDGGFIALCSGAHAPYALQENLASTS